jgi:DNA-binding transcriptional LysR family regulator
MELGSNEAIKQAVAGGLGITIMSLHALTLEPMQGQLAVLDVEGFPIERSWFVVYPRGKQLSVVAQTFFEFLKTEGSQLAASALAAGTCAQTATRQSELRRKRAARVASRPRH